MIITIISIIVLTGFGWLITKITPIKICPICAGVTLTWLSVFFGMFLGVFSSSDYQLPIAILAGGTVVGLMAKLEKSIQEKYFLLWKTVFVVSGFVAVYSLLMEEWWGVIGSIIIGICSTLLCKRYRIIKENSNSKSLKELEEKMKNCC